MKVIESIHIKNCFTHKDTFIEFNEGLNYIVGAEGAGKSLILECISFSFFGTVALRDSSSSYKKLETILIFNYLGSKFKIERKVSDANFYMFAEDIKDWIKLVNGTTPVNNKIISLFGYDYNIYLLSNYCEQGELQSFSKMTPAKRLAFIDKISGVEDAKELAVFLENRKKDLKKEIDTLSKLIVPLPDIDVTLLDVDFEKEIDKLISEKDLLHFKYIKSIELEGKLSTLNSEINFSKKENEKYDYVVKLYPKIYDLERAIQEQLGLLQQKEKLKNQLKLIQNKYYLYELNSLTITEKEILQYIDDLEYQNLVNEKKKLLDCPVVQCPACANTFLYNHLDLQQYDHIDLSFKFTPNLKIKEPQLLLNYFQNDHETYTKLLLEYNSIVVNEELIYKKDRLLFDYKSYLDLCTVIYNKSRELIDLKAQYTEVFDKGINSRVIKITDEINLLYKNKNEVEFYLKLKEALSKSNTQLTKMKKELKTIIDVLDKVKEFSTKIKTETLPLINYHASVLLNQMSDSVLNKIEITDSYAILVDDKNINVRSGSEKDTASLAFRLSLGNSIIAGMLPLFIGDEIDAASKLERTLLITNVLQNLSKKNYQIILITHKDTSNFEDCTIIDLNKL